MQELKTGALIEASCVIPYMLSNSFEKKYQVSMANIGYYIGKIYQITDDILDFESSTNTLGKTAGKDARDNKITYISMVGIDEALKIKANLSQKLKEQISFFPENLPVLQNLVNYIYKRVY